MMAGRYAHAKQFKRTNGGLRILRTRLGRLIRDIRRKIGWQAALAGGVRRPRSLGPARSARQQQRQRGWKLYSFHAPETECIGKGKASAPYEFGVKASHRHHQPPCPADSSCCTPGRCPAIHTTVTPCAT